MHAKIHTVIDKRTPVSSDVVALPIDGRTILFIATAYIIIVMSIHRLDIFRVTAFSALPLFVIIALRIDFFSIVKTVLFVSPFILVMAAANPLFDRTVIHHIGHIPITSGILSGTVIVGKAFLSLTAMLLLDRCISINGLSYALQRLRVPAVFTTQLLLLHRYIFLILSEAVIMLKSRDIRSAGSRWAKNPFVTANLIGTLLLRSAERSERVYRAMLARGFSGTFPVNGTTNFSFTDAVAVIGTLLILTMFRYIL